MHGKAFSSEPKEETENDTLGDSLSFSFNFLFFVCFGHERILLDLFKPNVSPSSAMVKCVLNRHRGS